MRRQFDFWIGEWSVTEGGKRAGENRIDRILGGCALLENWTSAGGMSGKSLNFYDPLREQWHQTARKDTPALRRSQRSPWIEPVRNFCNLRRKQWPACIRGCR